MSSLLLITPCNAGIVGFGNYAMTAADYTLPKFNSVEYAVEWVHKTKYIPEYYERLEIKVQNTAILILYNHHIRNRKDAEHMVRLMNEYYMYKLLRDIMKDYKDRGVGASVYSSSVPVVR